MSDSRCKAKVASYTLGMLGTGFVLSIFGPATINACHDSNGHHCEEIIYGTMAGATLLLGSVAGYYINRFFQSYRNDVQPNPPVRQNRQITVQQASERRQSISSVEESKDAKTETIPVSEAWPYSDVKLDVSEPPPNALNMRF